jgi:hypothetical protein
VNKFVALKTTLLHDSPDIFGMVETWLDRNILDSELSCPNYNIFRKDRLGRGGGLLLYINDKIICSHRPDLECMSNYYNEIMVCDALFSNNKKTAIILFYRPPSADRAFIENFVNVLNNVYGSGIRDMLIMGDLNLPEIDWEMPNSENDDLKLLLETIERYDLSQVNRCKSREINNNILDVVFTTFPHRLSKPESSMAIITSDHFLLKFYCELNVQDKRPHPKRMIYQFKNVNMDELEYHLSSVNFTKIINDEKCIESKWRVWKEKLFEILNKYVPRRKVITHKNSPWIDCELIHASKVKHTAWRKAKSSKKVNDWVQYKRINNQVKAMSLRKYNEYINRTFMDMNDSPKGFWKLFNHKDKKNSLPDIMYYDNKPLDDPTLKATAFNDFFYKSFNNQKFITPNINGIHNESLLNLVLEVDTFEETLRKLNTTKAIGVDGIPTFILKHFSKILAPSLTVLFNFSIQFSVLPREWKIANVVPIFKKGTHNNICNYRPISLLPVVSKVLERCVHEYIFNLSRNLIAENQFGFYPGRSTSSQLIKCYTEISLNLENNYQTDVIYLDLAKAFDSVPHNLLLEKLKKFGIGGKLLKWLQNYLTGRKQRVVVEGYSSSYKPVLSGVPQGSILGPLLFLYYINDIYEGILNDSKVYLYADDSKIFKRVITITDCENLQRDLNYLSIWSKTWGLKFNETKCKIMSISRKKNKILYDYNLNEYPLERVNVFCDLGVLITDDLTWEVHIRDMIRKANQRLGLVRRSLGYMCCMEAKLLAYKSLIRPLLEYCSVLWFQPYNKKLLKLLETIQRKSTKYILNNYDMNYSTRLSSCMILPMSYRFEYLDILFTYGLISGLVDMDVNSIIKISDTEHTTRYTEDCIRLVIPKVKTDYQLNFYTCRAVSCWNSLPNYLLNINEFENELSFKKELKNYYLEKVRSLFNEDRTCTWVSACKCWNCKL